MRKKIFKFLMAALTVSTMFTSSFMLTQDELSEFLKLQNALIESGVSIEEMDDYLGDSDIVTSTQMLREAQASGYFNKQNSTDPAATTAPAAQESTAPAPTPTPKHEHKYSTKLTKEPTCYEEGTLTYTCECGDTYEEAVAKLEHNYIEASTTEPTCTEDGEKEFKCTMCGDTYTETIEALGHTDGAWSISKKPTCTETGTKTRYCLTCKKEIGSEEIEALGHDTFDIIYPTEKFFSPTKIETKCHTCYETLETTIVPVPMWHYVVVIAPVVCNYYRDYRKEAEEIRNDKN